MAATTATPTTAATPATTFRRIGYAVWLTLLVTLALLTFPSAVPWMIAGWLGWHTVAIHRTRPGWVPLATCVGVLLIKRIYLTPGLLGFVVLALLVIVSRFLIIERKPEYKRIAWVGTVALWSVWGFAVFEYRAAATRSRPVAFDPARPVVCVGDSITSGLVGEVSYPQRLEAMLQIPVVNLGQNGVTTDVAYHVVPRIVAANPQIVVIELGGHDFLKGRSRAETKRNLERLIEACQQLGAEVVLFEIPRGFITDPFAGLEREIARERDLQLLGDGAIRNLVVWSPISPPGMWMPGSHLTEDGIHPNALGATFLAGRVAACLERMYGEQILAGGH